MRGGDNNRTREKQGNKQLCNIDCIVLLLLLTADSLSEVPLIMDKFCSRPRQRPCTLLSSLCINLNHPRLPAAARAIETATFPQCQPGKDPPRALSVYRLKALLTYWRSGLIWQVLIFFPDPDPPPPNNMR